MNEESLFTPSTSEKASASPVGNSQTARCPPLSFPSLSSKTLCSQELDPWQASLGQFGEVGWMLLPQTRQGTAQAIEGSFGLATMPARAMTIAAQEPAAQGVVARLQERQQKGISQRGHQEPLLPFLPVPQTGTRVRQLASVVAPRLLDLPATRIGKAHLPGLFLAGHRFVGQQIPG